MSARVYVAAPFSEWRRVRTVQGALRAHGAIITCDWTVEADKTPTGQTDSDVSDAVAVAAAVDDYHGVRTAHVVLLLTVVDKALGNGMWVELGIALAHHKRIVITGPQRLRNVFCRLADLVCERDEDGIAYALEDHETPTISSSLSVP